MEKNAVSKYFPLLLSQVAGCARLAGSTCHLSHHSSHITNHNSFQLATEPTNLSCRINKVDIIDEC
eukprot:scaffold9320_cov71-Cyclotella_meneghiniana.AAC.1